MSILINSAINFYEKIGIKRVKIVTKYNINIHKMEKFSGAYSDCPARHLPHKRTTRL